jgi:hypothetical protein
MAQKRPPIDKSDIPVNWVGASATQELFGGDRRSVGEQ